MPCVNGNEHHDGSADDFGCRIKHVLFAPSCFPTSPGGSKAAAMQKGEKQLGKDLDAFKRMRRQGLAVPRTRGAAKIESECESRYEVESAQPAWKQAKGVDAGKAKSQRGKEWRRRANEAHDAMRKGQVVG